MTPTDTNAAGAWYDRNAGAVAAQYEAARTEQLLDWARDLLPTGSPLVLDVGAGSGRDAAWFAAAGADVVALEPSGMMREAAARRHPDARIRWLDDALPTLARTLRLGMQFDLVLLSAVWQHVVPADRARAFRKLAGLLKPGGLVLLTLRLGPADAERAMHPVDPEEIEQLARAHGLAVERRHVMADTLGRAGLRWVGMALRLPDDGTGALPLLRHVILNDAKSSTYKLMLLRALCRIADGMAGLVRDAGEEHVALPLGLVALVWLRLFLPLLRHDLPQSPANRRGGDALGFVKAHTRAVLASGLSALDLRVGTRFGADQARIVLGALQEAADTITAMPATYMTYPNGGPVLPVEKTRPILPTGDLVLDEATLSGFGTMRVPRVLWQACGRFSCWVEPALIAESMRLMRGYAARQDRRLDEGVMAAALGWAEPLRDVAVPRAIALRQLEAGRALHCVWTGKRLEAAGLDIDHCLPWTAWPCSDLWNLLPADRRVNQHAKRDRLPSEALLDTARERILDWWGRAYLHEGEVRPRQFIEEAQASLPGLWRGGAGPPSEPAEVFTALRLQRLRLRHDQQVPEWRA